MSYIYSVMSVLAVGDDELGVGDDELTRSRVNRRLPRMTQTRRATREVLETSRRRHSHFRQLGGKR